MDIKSHRDLFVWQRAMALAAEVGQLAARLPASERFALATQLRRAAVSVPSNIAEGAGRFDRGDYRRSVSIARGSLMEADTQIELAVVMGYLTREEIARAEELSQEVLRMLTALWRTLKSPSAVNEPEIVASE
jgi:four helix bundle protein